MDIAFISTGYYPKHSGGASISTRLITDELQSAGHNVDIYTTTGSKKECLRLDTNLYEIPSGNQYRLAKRVGKNYGAARHLPDLERYDIVHVYGLGVAPGIVPRCNVPVLGTVNNLEWVCINWIEYLRDGCPNYGLKEAITLAYRDGYGPLLPIKLLLEGSFKRIVKNLDHFTVQNEGMKMILTRCGYDESSITVVPNVLDGQFLCNSDQKENTIISVGRLIEKKGVDDIVHAFSDLPPNIRDQWKLKLYGDGPLADMINRRATDENVNIYIDYVPYRELPSVYQNASLLIQGSKYPEPFSRTWLEAMASETPIICSKNPSSKTVLNDIAEFYDPFDQFSLKQVLKEVLTDFDKRQRMASKGKSAVSKYKSKRIVSEYCSLYQNMIQ